MVKKHTKIWNKIRFLISLIGNNSNGYFVIMNA